VPAQLEEIVVDANPLDREQVLPQPRNHCSSCVRSAKAVDVERACTCRRKGRPVRRRRCGIGSVSVPPGRLNASRRRAPGSDHNL
jgi:hypothetical protein